jgi:hypothetical protein
MPIVASDRGINIGRLGKPSHLLCGLPSCAQLLQNAFTLQLVLIELLGMLWVAVEELLTLTVMKAVVLLL